MTNDVKFEEEGLTSRCGKVHQDMQTQSGLFKAGLDTCDDLSLFPASQQQPNTSGVLTTAPAVTSFNMTEYVEK